MVVEVKGRPGGGGGTVKTLREVRTGREKRGRLERGECDGVAGGGGTKDSRDAAQRVTTSPAGYTGGR